MDLITSPSYHYMSSLARSRSDIRRSSSSLASSPAIRRSQSYSYGSTSLSTFTRPQYGYGGGYMSRSLSRSGSTLFGRSLQSSVLSRTPPLHSVGLQRSTPHYTDKYPYVRYSYGNTDTSLGITMQSESLGSTLNLRDLGTKRWLEGRLNTYNKALFTTPDYYSRIERPIAPARNYVRYMPVEDAMDKYRKRCMTVGTLSKYWLSPTTWQSRRDKEINLSSATSLGNYSYSSRYRTTPSYRSFANRLSYY